MEELIERLYLSGITNAGITTSVFTTGTGELKRWDEQRDEKKLEGAGGMGGGVMQAGRTSIRREDVKQRDHRGV